MSTHQYQGCIRQFSDGVLAIDTIAFLNRQYFLTPLQKQRRFARLAEGTEYFEFTKAAFFSFRRIDRRSGPFAG